LLTAGTAEFRGPGIHHRFDDSPDDYDMDMDQRTRMLGGGKGGRIILLGDGTEIVADNDNDVDMEDRGEAEEEEDKDLEEQVKKGQAKAKSDSTDSSEGRDTREETPAPKTSSSEPAAKADESKSEPSEVSKDSGDTPSEPKMHVPIDGADNKKIVEDAAQK